MNPTILLVEDDENDVFFMKLAGIGALQVALDGQQAIHYLHGADVYCDRAKFPLPCLILLDLKLPYVMGLDVLKWIRDQPELRAVIVIILSSSKAPEDIRAAYFFGANSYLVKPNEPQELSLTARLVKQYWLDLNQFLPAAEGAGRMLPPSAFSAPYSNMGAMDLG